VEPFAVDYRGDGVITVLDYDMRKLEHISTINNSISRLALPVRAVDFCWIGTRTFALGPFFQVVDSALLLNSTALVHEIAPDGHMLRSFSNPYRFDNRFVIETLGAGRMACSTNHGGLIWVGYSYLGETHSLTADGKVLWIARITDFNRRGFLTTQTSSGFDPNALAMDRIKSVTLLSDSVLAVQVETRTRANATTAPWDIRLRTYVLNAETGDLITSFSADHEIIGGGNGIAIQYKNAPFPRVSLAQAR
jgi:hypothetical protein